MDNKIHCEKIIDLSKDYSAANHGRVEPQLWGTARPSG